MSAWDQMQTAYFRGLYDRWKTQEAETNGKDDSMNDEEIYQLAEKYGDWDDFGRWVFRDSDRMLDFVDAIETRLKENNS